MKTNRLRAGWLALLPFLFGSMALAQTTYYISPGGNDANNGTSPATPWKTVAPVKANNYAVLIPGTSVLFERGRTHFVDNIRPVASGTAANPIVFGAYGTGDNPMLTGSVAVTGFTDVGGGVYSSPLSSTAVVRLVFREGQRQPIARHPNDGFFYTTSIPANTTANANMTKQSFIDNTRTEPTGYWVGATVGIRFDDWEWYSNTVTAYDGTTKQFMLNGVANNNLRAGWGYFFTNKREILDAPGEWYQNGATLFYMPPAGVDPSTLTLQAANVANAFNFQNVSYVRVENLSLEKYASNAVSSGISAPNTTRNDGLQFQNVRTVFSYGTGISLNSASNARIENCQVLDAQYEGINIQNCTGTELLNTEIRRTGLVPGLQYRAGGGIIVRSVSSTAQGSNNHIANCVIDSSGKHGIRLEESLITVEKTVIRNSALNSSDIGGIYLISATCKNVTLRQNFISDTKSYTGGLPPGSINLAATQKGRGLYVDDFAQDILMEDNTSHNNSSFGIHLINGKNVTLRRNLTFGNGVAEVNFQENNGRSPRVPIGFSKHTVQDNVFIATDPTGTVVRQEVQEYNGADFGQFSNNFYHHPFTKEVYMLSVPRNIPATPLVSPPASASAFRSSALLTVAEFQAFTGAQQPFTITGNIIVPASGAQDLNSTRSKFRFNQFDVTGTLSGNLITNGTFETGVGGWNNESSTDFALSQKDELNGKALSYQSKGTLVNRKAFTFNTILDPALFGVGSYFRLTFTAKATRPYATLQPYFAQNSGSFTSSVFAREVATRPVAENRDIIFPVSSPLLPSSVLKFAASIDAGEYFIDDVSLQKVSVTENDKYRQLLLTNPSGVPKTVDVAGLAGNKYPFTFFDKDSVRIGSSVTVPAWSSQVVFAVAATNTAPVATVLASQTATVGTVFAYTIPAFTDAETPNNLTYSASGLPVGMSFVPASRLLSGTPSLTGVSTVTITATDPGSLSVSTTFTLTVSASAVTPVVPTTPATLTITSFTCNTTNSVLSSVDFVVGYSDGTFTPKVPDLFINGVTITGQPGVPYSLGFDANQSSLTVQDQATRSTYFVWNFRQACAAPVIPSVPTAPTLTNQIAVVGTAFSYAVPAFSGSGPIVYSVSGLPAGMSFAPATRIISGIASATGVSTVVISASNAAGQSSGQFTLTVSASAVTPTGPATLTITSFTCNTTNSVLSSVDFVVGYSDGTFTPKVPDLFINGVTITGQPGVPYSLGFDANQSTLTIADQATRQVYFSWNFRQACTPGNNPFRLAAPETGGEMPLELYPNPAQTEVRVRQGESTAPIRVTIYGIGGQILRQETTRFNAPIAVDRLAPGLYMLNVQTEKQVRYLKLLRQ